MWNILCYTGLPWLVIFTAAGVLAKKAWIERSGRVQFEIHGPEDVSEVLLLAVMMTILIFLKNSMLSENKRIGLFTWMTKYEYEPPAESPRKKKAQHPPVDPEYLSRVPDGLVLGKKGKYYVRFPIRTGHALSTIILGTPGSGKSTLLLTSLIYEMHHKLQPGEKRQTYFILDVKPELRRKCSYPWDKHMKELSIQDRSQYGWDVYYNLKGRPSDDEILSELDVIARALIDAGKSEKNEFFYESARTIFKFVCLADFKKGRSFMQSVDHLMNGDMAKIVKQTLEGADGKPELLKVKRGLSGYNVGDNGGEAYQGIELAFRQSLEVFQRDDTKFFLDGNPRKLSPLTLEKRISVAFTIKTTRIKECKTILRLVVMQLIHHCEDRDEDRSHLITLVIDEAYRLGLINWIDFLSVCRSKQVSCVLAFQSLSQMQSVWSKEDADSLLEMVSAIAVLSCASTTTAKMICDWAGEYYEEKISTTLGGKNDGQASRSYEAKKILQPTDLMQLKRDKEIVLFLDGTYYRVDVDKARYYNIPRLKAISDKCVEAHKKMKGN